MVGLGYIAKKMLTQWECDPLEVSQITGVPENDCWDYVMRYNHALREAQDSYDPLKVQQEVRDWVKTIEDRNNQEVQAIKEKLERAADEPDKYDVKALLYRVNVLKGRIDKPTPEMISRAKHYPIAQLLNTQGKRGNVSCPFHKDKTPSFQIKHTNTFTCYSCGAYGDVIDLYQKLRNVSFTEAINNLQ